MALSENWDYESTVSPGFDRPDATYETFLGTTQKVVNCKPGSLYERFVFQFLRDKRDVMVLIGHILASIVTLWPSFLYMFFLETESISSIHIALHLKVFKHQILDYWIPVFTAPVYGHTLYTYFFHHIKMHHVSDNSPFDISSTLFYQRDSLIGFLHYFFRFYFCGAFDLSAYFIKHNQVDRAIKFFVGEVGTLLTLGYITYNYNTMAMVWCFWVPLTASRFGMMSGNWVQHTFLDPKDPLGGGLHNSITIIESRYNLLNYNDGYHASHHLNAQRHWSEHPREFLKKRPEYLETDAIVLKGTDYDDVFGLIMSGSLDKLAAKMVDIRNPAASHPKSVAERTAWLKERVKKFTWRDLERLYGVEFLNQKFGPSYVSAGLKREGWTGKKVE
ncbi:UNVERIFIED_CONTAM: hypothetical protein HDU68_008156 [Siphonaria sp. JEL0065]|nr:hypothetical protein HDU68_008156 [Siphonaria sp. JEL0065]